MVMEHYPCFLYHMETVPGRTKVEGNLPKSSTVNKVHLMYPRAEKLKNQKLKIERPPLIPTQKATPNTLVLSLTFP